MKESFLFLHLDLDIEGNSETMLFTKKQMLNKIAEEKTHNYTQDYFEYLNKLEQVINNGVPGDYIEDTFCVNVINWISIEEELPRMKAKDLFKGGTTIKVYHPENGIGHSTVSDHETWYHRVKEKGITHWYKE